MIKAALNFNCLSGFFMANVFITNKNPTNSNEQKKICSIQLHDVLKLNYIPNRKETAATTRDRHQQDTSVRKQGSSNLAGNPIRPRRGRTSEKHWEGDDRPSGRHGSSAGVIGEEDRGLGSTSGRVEATAPGSIKGVSERQKKMLAFFL